MGFISLEHLKESLLVSELSESLMAFDIMEPIGITCSPETSIPDVYKIFADYDIEAVPIIDSNKKVVGIAEKYTLDHYLHGKIIELHQKVASLEKN